MEKRPKTILFGLEYSADTRRFIHLVSEPLFCCFNRMSAMDEKRRNLFHNLEDVHKQMEQFLSHISRSAGGGSKFSPCLWEPPIDVYETDDELVVLCELPGIDRDHMEIIAEGQSLTIRGERKRSKAEPDGRYHRMEVCFGDFERVIDLPAKVDSNSARAVYVEGFLKVSFQKTSVDQSARVIRVTDG